MPAFNKRFRETTYLGVRQTPALLLVGGVLLLAMAAMSLTTSKSISGAVVIGLAGLFVLAGAVFAFVDNADPRIKKIRLKSPADRKSKQVTL